MTTDVKARSAGGAMTLPGRYYSSTEVLVREEEQIFRRCWLAVGHESQLSEPGSYFTTEILGESVLIVRDREETVRAFYNVCRHRGTRLCWEPEGTAQKVLVCPYHAWCYHLDGELAAAPHMDEVAGFERSDYSLEPVALHSWNGFLYVSLAPDPEPFERALGPLIGKFGAWQLETLISAAQQTYEIDANWKLVFQNYSECYHCPVAHPALNRLSPYLDSENDLDEGPVLGGPMRLASGAGSMSETGHACAPPLGLVSGADLEKVYYYTIFPTMLLSLHPDFVLVHRVLPLSSSRTRIVCDWYFDRASVAADGFDPSPAVDFWHATNQQDWELCRNAQLGVSSRAYRPGPYSEIESMSAAWDREYLKVLGESAE